MRFPPSFLDEIRDRVPISSLIGPRVQWDRRKTVAARGDWWACCPFHGEKSPSFHCEDKKARFYCFGCGASGDHFRFLMEMDGLQFPEAVQRVAELAGVPMPQHDPEAERQEQHRSSLQDIMEFAAAFFEERLQSPVGGRARAYLAGRDITPETQKAFRIGLAPDSRNALREHLALKGVTVDQMIACGLLVSGENIPVAYDRFRDRIIFPILDGRGQRPIAFGGRALGDDAPAKYLNSPETDIFHKGNVLFNFARARAAAARGGPIIAVEGYVDVIALAQAGIPNVVAPLGTALTEAQLSLLWRISDEPILCFDGDDAGTKAAWRAAALCLPMIGAGRGMRFAILPGGQDPDDLVRDGGPDAFRNVLHAARPLADVLFASATAGGVFDTPERRTALLRRLNEMVSVLQAKDARYHYRQALRERAEAMFSGATIAASDGLARSAIVRGGTDVMSTREAALLVLLVNHPVLLEENLEQVEPIRLHHEGARRMLAALVDLEAQGHAAGKGGALEAIFAAGLDSDWWAAVALVQRSRALPALAAASEDDARLALSDLLRLFGADVLQDEVDAAQQAFMADPTEANQQALLQLTYMSTRRGR